MKCGSHTPSNKQQCKVTYVKDFLSEPVYICTITLKNSVTIQIPLAQPLYSICLSVMSTEITLDILWLYRAFNVKPPLYTIVNNASLL